MPKKIKGLISRICGEKHCEANILKNVNEISFTEVKNLFNNDSKKRQALIDRKINYRNFICFVRFQTSYAPGNLHLQNTKRSIR